MTNGTIQVTRYANPVTGLNLKVISQYKNI